MKTVREVLGSVLTPRVVVTACILTYFLGGNMLIKDLFRQIGQSLGFG